MKLSDHFSLLEATKSQTALRLGIENAPSVAEVEKLKFVANAILEPVRARFEKPFSPSSWYRSPALCEAIGSSPDSQHAKAEAVDFEVPGIANNVLAEMIFSELEFDQLILEFWKPGIAGSGWVHCSVVQDRENRRQALQTSDGRTYRPWEPD